MFGNNSGDLYLAIDQGGHASRALVFDASGRQIAEAENTLDTFRPRKGYVEHDPEQLMASISNSIEEVCTSLKDKVDNIVSAGLATQRANIVCWDRKTGEALSPVISWQDIRAWDKLSKLKDNAVEVHMKTGLFLSPHYGASKLEWCLENLNDLKTALMNEQLCIGPMSSFIVRHLTIEESFVSDPVSASRTLLWNIHKKDWDADLVDYFGLPYDALPSCVPNLYDFGSIKIGRRDIPLKLVTGDQSAALFSSGKLRSEDLYVNAGTGAFVSRATGSEPVSSRRLLTSLAHQQPGEELFVMEGTVNGAGSAMEWAKRELEQENIFKKLPYWLGSVKDPPLFLNGISGLAAPFWVPDFPSEFIGNGKGREKIVAVLESIVFLINANLIEMNKSVPPPEEIRITGGLSRINGLCQKLADLTHLPVYRPAETEATAKGTCFLLTGMPAKWSESGKGKRFKPEIGKDIMLRYRAWEDAMLTRMRGE